MAVDSNANDELLQLKKRARRRLVGAVVLMLVALLVLSFVMGTRPEPVEKIESIAIDGVKTNQQAPAANAFAKPPVAVAAVASEPSSSPAIAKEPPKLTKPVASEKPVQASKKPTTTPSKPLPTKVVTKPAVVPLKEKSTKTVANTPVKKEVTPTENGKKYSASVVALSDANKAAELQRKLSAHGLKAYTEKVEVGGKTLTRVKVGPYESASDLEKARAKLSLMGL